MDARYLRRTIAAALRKQLPDTPAADRVKAADAIIEILDMQGHESAAVVDADAKNQYHWQYWVTAPIKVDPGTGNPLEP